MKVFFFFFRLIIKGISLIPLPVVFIFTRALAAFLNYVVGYRKKVILNNLKNSFPEKTEQERQKIANGFYKSLADIFFEIIHIESITKKELFKRVTVSNEELLEQLANQKKGVLIVMSHCGNWEWIGQRVCFAGERYEYVGIVAKEISNPYFDKYFTDLRLHILKDIIQLIPFTQTARYLSALRRKAGMFVSIADQTPHRDQIQYRTNFLNQSSGIFMGPERIARSMNYAVVFCHATKPRKGYYHIDFELITDNPSEMAEYEITNRHVKLLEDNIKKQPEIWLWSHRRWKY